ncbi:MAG: chromate efflux transporter [Wenzhouxiangella sp.]
MTETRQPPCAKPSLAEALRVWWQVAFLSFGGPAAQIAVMQRLIVDEKGWLEQARFNHALNFCMLLPGPEAQQLATYIGWLLHGVRGGLLAGVIFVLPGAVLMLGLSLAYVTLGQVGLVEGLLFGLKCAVLAIVAQALWRMGGKIVQGRAAIGIAVVGFVAMFVFNLAFPLVVLGAGLAGLLLYGKAPVAADQGAEPRPMQWRASLLCLAAWLLPLIVLLAWLGRDSVWTEIAGFFSLVAVAGFGGAYAVLAWVAQFAAESRDWVTAAEMLDGLGLAEATPGPLILVTQFVGFLAAWRHDAVLHPLLAGSLGGMLTTWVMFAPSFLWVFLFAPRIEQLRSSPRIAGALRGITAAVVGVIANLAVWFGLRLLFANQQTVTALGIELDLPVLATLDPWALGFTALAAVLLFRLKWGLYPLVGTMAVLGLLAGGLGLLA